MKGSSAFWWTALTLLLVGLIAWLLGLGDMMHASVTSGHLLDWIMGAFCLIWLLAILKIPWDLYFQATEVAFEQQRSRERQIALAEGREEYIQKLRRRLCALAIGSHLFSALLIAGITHFTGRSIGYYFAVFYLVSTLFRPAVAGYVYLARKLRSLGEEAHYPREDVVEMREKLKWQEITLRDLTDQIRDLRDGLEQERAQRGVAIQHLEGQRESEFRELRQNMHSLSREFETTISRLTDNQEVIKGIQAFVRLIARSTTPET